MASASMYICTCGGTSTSDEPASSFLHCFVPARKTPDHTGRDDWQITGYNDAPPKIFRQAKMASLPPDTTQIVGRRAFTFWGQQKGGEGDGAPWGVLGHGVMGGVCIRAPTLVVGPGI